MVKLSYGFQEFQLIESAAEPPGGFGGGSIPGGSSGGSVPGGSGGGSVPGGSSGGSSSSSVSWSGATEITTAGNYSNKTYQSTTADQNSVLIDASVAVTLTNPTVTKSGDSDGGDNCNFYGINSGIMVKDGATVTITGGTVTASATGANGVFSYGGNGGQNGAAGDGTTIYISGTTIKTTGDNAGGIMTTGGGKTVANNLTITTSGQSSAPIRTDRGGGNVTVTGGSYTSNGLGSPAIYSTADIVVSDATLTSNLSEGVCIEGQNSVALTNCTLTANNTKTNGQATFLDSIMIYQSMSGDANSGTSSFTMTGGILNSKSGHVFHVTNTSAVINLSNVTINNTDSAGVLLSVCNDGWSGDSNEATLNADNQSLVGDILVGSDSTLNLSLTNFSTLNGGISGSITNSSGSSVSSTVGTVNVTLDTNSKWYLTGDTYISSIAYEGSASAANIINNGYTLYVNSVALSGTTDSISSGGSSDTLMTVTDSTDTPVTVGSAVKIIDASSRTTAVQITGNSLANTIQGGSKADTINGGSGADIIYGNAGADKLFGDNGKDTIYGGGGKDYIEGGAGADLINGGNGVDTIVGGKGKDTLTGGNGNDVFIYASGDGSDLITDYTADQDLISLSAGSVTSSIVNGDDVILTVGSGTITLEGAVNTKISIINASNSTLNLIQGSTSKDTINGTTSADLIYGDAGADSIFANAGKDTVYGGAGKDYIEGGAGADILDGGAGADTIVGGKGKDTLTGGAGKNVFIYSTGDGNDIITDFKSKDTLKISGSWETVVSGDDVIVTVGSGKITLQGASSETINIIENTSKSYVELFEDDNFLNDDLVSIIDKKSDIINDTSFNSKDINNFAENDLTKISYNRDKNN